MDKKAVLMLIDFLISVSYNSGWHSGFMEGMARKKDKTRGVEKYDRKLYEERLKSYIRERGIMKAHLLEELKLNDGEECAKEIMDEEETKELLSELIGVGIHTFLRKGTDSREAMVVWSAIYDLEDGEWESAVDYVAKAIMKKFTVKIK